MISTVVYSLSYGICFKTTFSLKDIKISGPNLQKIYKVTFKSYVNLAPGVGHMWPVSCVCVGHDHLKRSNYIIFKLIFS
jgi:hypothetical protein